MSSVRESRRISAALDNRPPLHYYIFVKPIIFLLLFAALAGCDRGAHPDKIGQLAPSFTVSDGQRTISLHDYRGKVVVLNFWATWCPPCAEETPSLVAMQQSLRPYVTVLAISTDSDDAVYRTFVRDRMAGVLTVRDGAKASSTLYGTFAYPETYIIDRQGILRRKFIGPVDWTKPEITDYLKKLG